MSSEALSRAIARTRANIAAKAAAAPPKASTPKPTTTQPPANSTASTAKRANASAAANNPISEPSRTHPKSPTRKKNSEGTDHSRAKTPEIDALWRLFQLPDHPDAVVALIGPKLQGILDGLLSGASKPGMQGSSDRLTLGKMLGATWARSAAAQSADVMAAAGAIGDRISRAIARREGGSRPSPVTLDAASGLEVADNLAFLPHARMLGEHVRSPARFEDDLAAEVEGKTAEEEEAERVAGLLGRW